MSTEKIDNVCVTAKANVYFDGKCVSHNITLPDGTRKSVGVVLANTNWLAARNGCALSLGKPSAFQANRASKFGLSRPTTTSATSAKF